MCLWIAALIEKIKFYINLFIYPEEIKLYKLNIFPEFHHGK